MMIKNEIHKANEGESMEEKKSTKAKFDQVSAEIEKRIHEGVYVSSQKLPSEYDLAKEFDCSRLTIRKAIDDLITKNILVKRRGKGSYVMSQPKFKADAPGCKALLKQRKLMEKPAAQKLSLSSMLPNPQKRY